ncbi:LOW QUALITY PROTEIN: proteasome assembly chaperone 3 [Pholidichthys leucotaenia]
MCEPIIRTRQAQKDVNGISTEVVCTEFSNYIFIVLTQYGKIGTLISVTPNSRSSDISTPTLSTKVLLGKDEPLTHVCENLVTFVSQEANRQARSYLDFRLKDSSQRRSQTVSGAHSKVVQSGSVWVRNMDAELF